MNQHKPDLNDCQTLILYRNWMKMIDFSEHKQTCKKLSVQTAEIQLYHQQ